MNTPAHLAASLLVWRGEPGWTGASAIAVGALLPDLPMFGFYAYQKAIGSSESQIWSDLYFRSSWQLLFDTFNSFPVMIAVVAISYACGVRWGVLLGASAILHLCCDFPLHHDDAHRHFLPFSNWRFVSPVSYWDPKHYGFIFILDRIGLCDDQLFLRRTDSRAFAHANRRVYYASALRRRHRLRARDLVTTFIGSRDAGRQLVLLWNLWSAVRG